MGGAITPKRRDMPSACFQSVDALSIALKHAKGMSLRYGVVVLSDLHHSLVLFVGDSGGGVGENH